MALLSDVSNFYQQNYGQPGQGNGKQSLTDFRFDPTFASSNQSFAPILSNFNSLQDAGNVNKAYSSLLAAPNGAQIFKSAFGDNDATNGLSSKIVNNFTRGGSPLGTDFDPQYTYDPSTQLGPKQGSDATYAQFHNGMLPNGTAYTPPAGLIPGTNIPTAGTPVSALMTGQGSGNPASAGSTPPAPVPATAGASPAPLPGTGNTSYAAPITDPSAYLDPSMAFQMQQGTDAIQNSAAARGGLNSGQTLKDLTSFSQGLAGTNWQNAFNNAQTDTNRRYGVNSADRTFDYNAANNDRQFGYNAAVDDRNFNANQNQQQAQMGLQGSQGNASLQSALAALLSGNSIAAGQAQGTGTVGANNSLTNALSQILSQMYGNNALATIFPNGAG